MFYFGFIAAVIPALGYLKTCTQKNQELQQRLFDGADLCTALQDRVVCSSCRADVSAASAALSKELLKSSTRANNTACNYSTAPTAVPISAKQCLLGPV
jgi:hypothetical protein